MSLSSRLAAANEAIAKYSTLKAACPQPTIDPVIKLALTVAASGDTKITPQLEAQFGTLAANVHAFKQFNAGIKANNILNKLQNGIEDLSAGCGSAHLPRLDDMKENSSKANAHNALVAQIKAKETQVDARQLTTFRQLHTVISDRVALLDLLESFCTHFTNKDTAHLRVACDAIASKTKKPAAPVSVTAVSKFQPTPVTVNTNGAAAAATATFKQQPPN